MPIPPTILLLDTDPDGRRRLGRSLSRRGYRIRAACDADEAKAALAEEVPALIIVVETADGEMREHLRKRPAFFRVPVLQLTEATPDPDLADRVGRSGG